MKYKSHMCRVVTNFQEILYFTFYKYYTKKCEMYSRKYLEKFGQRDVLNSDTGRPPVPPAGPEVRGRGRGTHLDPVLSNPLTQCQEGRGVVLE
jgi:hypothetical protein